MIATDMTPEPENPEPENSERLRIALWQCAPLPPDTADAVAANLARLDTVMARSAGTADLLITPEMFVTGYHVDVDVLARRADPPGGPIAERIADLCARHGLALLYGCAEIDPDAQVFNTIRLVDATRAQLASHRKTHLFGDVDRSRFTAGHRPPPVVELGSWRLGLLICYEVEFGELVRSLALRGADLICVPTANMPEYDEVQRILLPARALESQVYLAYANYVGAEGDLRYGGLSVVLGPEGIALADAGRDETVVVAELDRRALDASRAVRPYLAQRRPEVY
ncbi:MAG: carbon-nitrogen hydrolase family protein [Gordonia sp. (in: high G+C Gram-positive bacteria)]